MGSIVPIPGIPSMPGISTHGLANDGPAVGMGMFISICWLDDVCGFGEAARHLHARHVHLFFPETPQETLRRRHSRHAHFHYWRSTRVIVEGVADFAGLSRHSPCLHAAHRSLFAGLLCGFFFLLDDAPSSSRWGIFMPGMSIPGMLLMSCFLAGGFFRVCLLFFGTAFRVAAVDFALGIFIPGMFCMS